VGSVNVNNTKGLADMAQVSMGIATQNQVQSQARINDVANNIVAQSLASAQQIADQAGRSAQRLAESAFIAAQNQASLAAAFAQAVTTQSVKRILDLSIENAVADQKLIGADLQDKISNLGSALSAVQQDIKAAQSTAPQTGTGGAFGSDSGSALMQQLASNQALQAQQLGQMNVILQELAAHLVTAKTP
jgi:hypothetical protein